MEKDSKVVKALPRVRRREPLPKQTELLPKGVSAYSTDPPVDKNSKEAFLKKLQTCSKVYDYNDETKDVRGKVSGAD